MRLPNIGRVRALAIALALVITILIQPPDLPAGDLTLEQAVDLALNQTTRGSMIRGRLDIAQMNYDAKRINFYVPEISINGSLPSYAEDESYRPYTNPYDKELFETTNLDFTSNIRLRQSLITGGVVTATANLIAQDNRYPDTRFNRQLEYFVNEDSRRGFLDLSLQQPLLRPSQAKFELNNRRDNLTIAEMTRAEEQANLKQEVTAAYLMMLRLSVQRNMYEAQFESARLQAEIDSMKLADGILAEDDYLLSVSARLDAELQMFEVEADLEQQRSELSMLLDLDPQDSLRLFEPEPGEHLSEQLSNRLAAAWVSSVPVRKAEHEYYKAERNADFTSGEHGLTGDLEASYSLGRQNIERERFDPEGDDRVTLEDNIKTMGWQVSLVFSLPVWDGGAGRAEVEAARFQAEQSRLEYESAKYEARASLVTLIDQLDVGHRRLGIVAKQVELAQNKLEIARERHQNGEISMITLLESEVFYLETRDKYLEELSSYLSNRISLEGMFVENPFEHKSEG
jgi:outer membrane protein TolC